jgi:hypothetical protein
VGAVGADGTAALAPDAAAAASGDAPPSGGKDPPLAGLGGLLLRSLFLAGFAVTLLNVRAKSAAPPVFLVESADWALACEAGGLGAGALATETTGALKAMVTEFMPGWSK